MSDNGVVKAILDRECKAAIKRNQILLVCQPCCYCLRNDTLAREIVEAVRE